MQRGALYIRVSTTDQYEKELSPDAQLRLLKEYAAKNQINIQEEHIFIEPGVSAKTDKRPAFQLMIAMAKSKPKPFDVILVHKFDRFARNRDDSVVYKKLLRKNCKIDVVSITEQTGDSPTGKLLEGILEVVAEFYSLNLAQEVKKGQTEKALKGEFMARPPLGYEIKEEGKLPVIVPKEAEIVRLIYDKFTNHNWSYWIISRHLNDSGFRMPSGAKFTTQRIKYVLNNPMYCGILRWNMRDGREIREVSEWIIAEGEHSPIIDRELFERAQSRIKEIKESSGKYQKPGESLSNNMFAGLMRCGNCGGPMSFMRRMYKGEERSRYQCSRYQNGTCKVSHSISVFKIEAAILEAIKLHAESKIELSVEVIKTSNTSERDMIEKSLAQLKNKYKKANDAYLNDIYTMEQFNETKRGIEAEEKALLEKLHSLESGPQTNPSDLLKEKLKSAYLVLSDPDISIEDKKRALRSFVKQITYKKASQQLDIDYYILG